jgi:hypothetical protein
MFRYLFEVLQILTGVAVLAVLAWYGAYCVLYANSWLAVTVLTHPAEAQGVLTLALFGVFLNLIKQKSKI